ncbi:hypothetical protein C8R46DRAFT_1050553 [Mycena filopes]|nr:hypothetical protein C8R46DRAFT_1050553 [Mycena filopes]
MAPENHPRPLNANELEHLVGHLSDADMDELIDILGLSDIAEQLPPILTKVIKAAQRHMQLHDAPELDDDIDTLIRNFDELSYHSTFPSPPSLSTLSATADLQPSSPWSSTPTTATPPRASPPHPSLSHTPQTPGGRRAAYDVDSPSKTGKTVSWLEAGALTLQVRGAAAAGSGVKRRKTRTGPHPAYGVFYGGKVGVFERWVDVNRSITGHGAAIHCGFPSVASAHAALSYARAQGWTGDSTVSAAAEPVAARPYAKNPLNDGADGVWYAVCRGVVPGVYRSWLECALNTVGIRGNLSCSFGTQGEAEAAYAAALTAGYVRVIRREVSL